MSSSPTPALTPAGGTPTRPDLLSLLVTVPDPRDPRGLQHRLPAILAVGLAAVLARARSFVAIGEWVAHQPAHALTELGVPGRGPGESTIRRAFARLEADTLDLVLGAYLWTRTSVAGGRRIITIDGKTVRGARTSTKAAPHLVAAFDHTAGAVLGQVAVTAKSNEIPALQGLRDSSTSTASWSQSMRCTPKPTPRTSSPLLAATTCSPSRATNQSSARIQGPALGEGPGPPSHLSRSSTRSPPPTTQRHHQRPSQPGSKVTGASRTDSTGSAM